MGCIKISAVKKILINPIVKKTLPTVSISLHVIRKLDRKWKWKIKWISTVWLTLNSVLIVNKCNNVLKDINVVNDNIFNYFQPCCPLHSCILIYCHSSHLRGQENKSGRPCFYSDNFVSYWNTTPLINSNITGYYMFSDKFNF